MMSYAPLIALILAGLLSGCADPSTHPAAASPAPQALKYTYPTVPRIEIVLTTPERDFMLNEMRYYLDMLLVASDALSRDDFDTVAKIARSRVPVMNTTPLPPTLESSLPSSFLAVWRSTHELVDELALIAEKTRSTRATLRQMSVVLQRCNECHAVFQFRAR
jgi:hypothetical protein